MAKKRILKFPSEYSDENLVQLAVQLDEEIAALRRAMCMPQKQSSAPEVKPRATSWQALLPASYTREQLIEYIIAQGGEVQKLRMQLANLWSRVRKELPGPEPLAPAPDAHPDIDLSNWWHVTSRGGRPLA